MFGVINVYDVNLKGFIEFVLRFNKGINIDGDVLKKYINFNIVGVFDFNVWKLDGVIKWFEKKVVSGMSYFII